MKFKRKKCRRSIKCSHCTPYRWLGNRKGRFKPQDEALMKEQIRMVRGLAGNEVRG